MTRVRIEFTTAWQPRKLTMMLADIKVMLAQEGAPGAQVTVIEDPPPEPTMLTLECSECWEPGRPAAGSKRERRRWQAETFTPCPKCGHRETVGKVVEPQPPPNPESVGAPA